MPAGDFTNQAAAYRARPGYPAELIDQLVTEADVRPGDPVVDFGAGTGLFTKELLARRFGVTAVEPNERMRSLASVPGACWIDATFEKTQLAATSQRWATAAQAFHWADPARALPEMHRILQPRCLLTAVWNVKVMDADPLLRWTADAIRRHVPDFREHYEGKDWPLILESTGDFRFTGAHAVRHVVPMSRERFLELWRSHHWLQHLAAAEAFDDLLMELNRHFSAKNIQEIVVPYECIAYSARRSD